MAAAVFENSTRSRAISFRKTVSEVRVLDFNSPARACSFGWKERTEAVARYYDVLPAEERQKTAIFGSDYGRAGAIDHFEPALGLPKAICSHHSYLYWGSRGYTGESVIALDVDLEYLQRHCASVTLVADPKVQWARPDLERPIYHCRRLDHDLTKGWDAYRHFD